MILMDCPIFLGPMSSESRKHSYKHNIKKRETYFKKGNQAYLQRQDIQMKLSQDEVVEDTGKDLIDQSSKEEVCTWIIELFGYCKGGYLNIHIWAWFTLSSAQKAKSGLIYLEKDTYMLFKPPKQACIP